MLEYSRVVEVGTLYIAYMYQLYLDNINVTLYKSHDQEHLPRDRGICVNVNNQWKTSLE